MKVYRTKVPVPQTFRTKNLPKVPKPSRRLLAYGAIVGVVVIVAAIWGLTLLSNLSVFWDSLRGSGAVAAQSESHIVGSPTIYSLPIYTNKPKISVSGSGQSGAVVTLYLNGQKVADQIVGNDGQFVFNDADLKEGLNSFTAKQAIDTSESPESSTENIQLDLTPPKLTVDKPADGSSSSAQYVYVSGKAEVGSYVMINDHQAVVAQDGTYNGVAQLQSGDNKITITATDGAGNKSTITRAVSFNGAPSPPPAPPANP